MKFYKYIYNSIITLFSVSYSTVLNRKLVLFGGEVILVKKGMKELEINMFLTYFI